MILPYFYYNFDTDLVLITDNSYILSINPNNIYYSRAKFIAKFGDSTSSLWIATTFGIDI